MREVSNNFYKKRNTDNKNNKFQVRNGQAIVNVFKWVR